MAGQDPANSCSCKKQSVEVILGRNIGSAELVFRVLTPGDPEINRVDVESPDNTHRIEIR